MTHPAATIQRLSLILLVVVATASFVACQPQDQQSSAQGAAIDTAAIRASLDSVGKVIRRAYRARDAELLSSTWAGNGILSDAGRPLVKGRDSIAKALMEQRESRPDDAEVTGHLIERRVLSKNGRMSSGSTR